MEKSSNYTLHSVCVVALFVLGGTVITLPQGEGANLLWCFVCAAAAAVVLSLLIFPIINKLTNLGGTRLKSALHCIFMLLLLWLTVWSGLSSIIDYTRFVGDVMLPRSPLFLIFALFAALTVAFALCSNSGIMKFSLLSLLICAVCVAYIFIVSLGQFNIKALFSFKGTTAAAFFKGTLNCLYRAFLPCITAVTFLCLANVGAKTSVCVSGVALGAAISAVVLADILLVLTSAASSYQYPYNSAVSVITAGSLYTRPDGFAYGIKFFVSVVRVGVSTKVSVMIIKNLLKKRTTKNIAAA